MPAYELTPIGLIESPFVEKFGLPRQPGLIKHAKACVRMLPPYDQEDAFRGIASASHLWLIFGFHQHYGHEWKPLVRPPRLGGNKKVGVFATRSSFRPNPIGMSVVAFQGLRKTGEGLYLDIGCPDLIDGTPIYDIKPYLPYADGIHDAHFALAEESPDTHRLNVTFSSEALSALQHYTKSLPALRSLIEEVIAQDPRPAYRQTESSGDYGIRLYGLNILWTINQKTATVTTIQAFNENSLV
ncbi:MAG: tRNA (N6-threonylcarbamoyladenosine(37)-N6)-methyltransferase TrmO [Oleiphilaceae bacterium]|nr:tRNA (N6-threonylcarbamoyladenosine(37)-N6)-methyltransferase TrmO [Oleiphilaceae bacterium]